MTAPSCGARTAPWYRSQSATFRSASNAIGLIAQAGALELAAGELLIVGTDGIWDAANAAGERYGRARFTAMVASQTADATRATISAGMLAAVAAWRGDITLVVIRRRG